MNFCGNKCCVNFYGIYKSLIVIAHKTGQLGNRLFLFAHVIAHAAEHNIKVFNPSFDEYAQYFVSTSSDIFCRYPIKSSIMNNNHFVRAWYHRNVFRWACWGLTNKKISRVHQIVQMDWEDGCDLSDSQIQQLVGSKFLFIAWGFRFRDYRAIQKHSDTVREYFRPIPTIGANVSSLIAQLRKNTEVLIGIHIRRGDYKQHLDGRFFYEVKDYLAVMKQMVYLFAGCKVTFLICSNESLDRAIFEGFEIGFGTNHLVEDMYAFAQCDYLIGPPSTYTGWASFYGKVPRCQLVSRHMQISLDDFEVCLDAACDDDRDPQNQWIQSDGKSILQAHRS